MANKHASNKYITLDDVRVSHSHKDDTIHITSGDPDVQAGGFHLSLSKNTQTEKTLRDLLTDSGVIASTPRLPVAENFKPAEPAGFTLDEVVKRNGKGKVITLASAKGGSGKTTTALLLAGVFASKGLKTVVVDMDIRNGEMGFLIKETSPTVLNVFVSSNGGEPDKIEEALKENLIYDKKLDVHVLLATKRASSAEHLTPKFYADVIEELKTKFDVVVLDTSSNYLDTYNTMVALPIADAILYVTGLGAGSLYSLIRWFDEISYSVEQGGAGVSKEQVGIVVNHYTPLQEPNLDVLEVEGFKKNFVAFLPSAERTFALVGDIRHHAGEVITGNRNEYSTALFKLGKSLLDKLKLG